MARTIPPINTRYSAAELISLAHKIDAEGYFATDEERARWDRVLRDNGLTNAADYLALDLHMSAAQCIWDRFGVARPSFDH